MTAATGDLSFEHVYEAGTGPWTLLLLHGTGGNERDLVSLGRQLLPGAALLSPRGQVSESGMPRFFRRLAVGRLDIPDLLVRTDDLAAFVREATDRHGLDPDHVVAVGLSNGANIAVSLLMRHPGLLRGAVLLRPMLPYEPDAPLNLDGTDVQIAAGEGDPFSSPEQTRRLADILTGAGATVTAYTEPGAGHALSQGDLLRAVQWLARLAGPV
ncbi:MAG: alpha/beta hydrolase [Solirubrobacteraceae bacterium]